MPASKSKFVPPPPPAHAIEEPDIKRIAENKPEPRYGTAHSIDSDSAPVPLFLTGEEVGLRALESSDIGPRYLGWLNDREITRYLETGTFPLTLSGLERYYERISQDTSPTPSCVFFAIQHLTTGLHIGNIKIEPIHWLHRTGTLGLLIGDRDFQGRGHGAEATRLCLHYAFQRLGLRKISLGVLANNLPAIRLYQKLGFVSEGCKQAEYWIDGTYQDAHQMALFAENFTRPPMHRYG